MNGSKDRDFTEKNRILLLEKRGIDLNKLPVNESLVPEKSAKGAVTARIGERYIHSRHDPAGEAFRIVKASAAGNFDCWVFGGLGLGYHVESFLQLGNDAKAVVVEPDISFLAAAAESRDLERIINSRQVYFVFSKEPDDIIPVLNSLQCESINFFQIRSVYELDRDFYDRLKTGVSSYISRKEINNNTLKRFAPLWVKNLSENLPAFSTSPGLIHLEGKFSGIPALILAGGPGLDRVIPYLGELYRKYLVIAVDTSLRACELGGITPDIAVVVDPQYWNYRHLDRAREGNTILISEPSTYSRVFRKFSRYRFFAGSVFPLGRYIEEQTFERGKIGAGGSVATSAWDFARQAGCLHAVFAGLDLGYPGRQTHFRGSFFEERAHTLSARTRPASDMDFSLITDASLSEYENFHGKMVLTDRRLSVYRQWFEEQFSMHKFPALNLSGEGARIRGMGLTGIEDALSMPDIREKIDGITASLRAFTEEYRKDKAQEVVEKTLESVENLLTYLDRLLEYAVDGEKTALFLLERHNSDNSAAENTEEIKEGMARLDRIDSLILSGAQRNIAGFLLQDTIRQINLERGKTDFASVMMKSLGIYRGLSESVRHNIKYLAKSREKMSDFMKQDTARQSC